MPLGRRSDWAWALSIHSNWERFEDARAIARGMEGSTNGRGTSTRRNEGTLDPVIKRKGGGLAQPIATKHSCSMWELEGSCMQQICH